MKDFTSASFSSAGSWVNQNALSLNSAFLNTCVRCWFELEAFLAFCWQQGIIKQTEWKNLLA